MKTSFLTMIAVFIISSTIYAQIGTTIPPNKRGDWENAGLEFNIPNDSDYDSTFYSTGWHFNGINDALTKAVQYLNSNPDPSTKVLIQLYGGIYNIHRPIYLSSAHKNITIRGHGNDPNSSSATVLRFFYDPQFPDTNYEHSYDVIRNCIRIAGTSNIGIENLKIDASNLPEDISRIRNNVVCNIFFRSSSNCWVKNVYSYKPIKQHIGSWYSDHLEVRDCIFEEAFSYGVGGTGYGVAFGENTSYCLVENNIFRYLRHSMVVSSGANNNVFGYNYSREQFDQYGLELGDICIHGRYPYKNLFEGNRVDRIWADMFHGSNGSYNTFFRNYTYYGIIKIETERYDNPNPSIPNSAYGIGDNTYNILGNEGKTHYLKIDLDSQKIDVSKPAVTFDQYGIEEYLNNSIEHVNWNSTFESAYILRDVSYYKDTIPSFFTPEFTWPCIGPPTNSGMYTSQDNPARKKACTVLGWPCSSSRFITLTKNSLVNEKSESINGYKLEANYPNPFNPVTNISYELPKDQFVRIEVFNSIGEKVKTLVNENKGAGKYKIVFDAKDLPSGFYFYRIKAGKFSASKKMVLMR